jgi:hypothetical protein
MNEQRKRGNHGASLYCFKGTNAQGLPLSDTTTALSIHIVDMQCTWLLANQIHIVETLTLHALHIPET